MLWSDSPTRKKFVCCVFDMVAERSAPPRKFSAGVCSDSVEMYIASARARNGEGVFDENFLDETTGEKGITMTQGQNAIYIQAKLQGGAPKPKDEAESSETLAEVRNAELRRSNRAATPFRKGSSCRRGRRRARGQRHWRRTRRPSISRQH